MASDNTQAKKTRIYRLSLVDGQSRERLWSLRFNRTTFIIAVVSAVVVILVGIFSLIAFTPIRTFIPGYPDAHSKRQAIQNAMRIDSLETRIVQWELYTENLRRVVAGAEPIRLDSLIHLGGAGTGEASSVLSERDSLLRSQLSAEQAFEISGQPSRRLPIEAVTFFPPLKGVISTDFDRAVHPWVEITAPSQSTVLSVLDGTVVFTGWDESTGYIVAVQHEGDILSVYRHNRNLLKKEGDRVKAGTPLSMAEVPLFFELWYRGEAVDPALYISF
jgi:murein DD-endopeptidase MepM/ murein hydrolase activator NlpD